MIKILNKSSAFIIVSFLLVLDLALFALYFNNYQINFLKTSWLIYPMIINILLLILISRVINKFRFIYIGLSVIIILCLFGTLLLKPLLPDTKFDTVTSPNRTTLYIAQSEATLGETNYFYTVYKKEPYLFGIVIKKITEFKLMYGPENIPSTEDALRLDSPTWDSSDKIVVFHSTQGDIIVNLK